MATKDADTSTPGLHVTPVNIGGDSLVDRLVPQLPKIAAVVGVIIVLVAVVFGYRWYKHSQEAKSTTRLAQAVELGERMVLTTPPPAGEPVADEFFASYQERALASAAAFAKVGDARGAARLYEANQLMVAGKVDDAIAIFRRASTGTGDDGVLAREGLALALETKAGLTTDPAAANQLREEALATIRTAQPDDRGLRRDYALYHEARLLETLQRPTEAIAPLQKALQVAPTTSLRQDIENRLAVLGAAPLPDAPAEPTAPSATP
ncbi:MAG: hypothetical protein R3B06_18735 [Kofleriaceae bacterium]